MLMHQATTMSLPTQAEINVYDSLDERSACEHFLGKTLEEAEALFAENVFTYYEDLFDMGPAAFRFYVEAAIRHIKATRDKGSVSYFASVLEYRIECEPSELIPISADLLAICRYILANPDECGIRKTRREIESMADGYRRLAKSHLPQGALDENFDIEQFLDLQRRYEVLRDTFVQMAEENRPGFSEPV
jgi:hypothetical protein